MNCGERMFRWRMARARVDLRPQPDRSSGYIQQKSYLDFGTKTLDPVT
jgi:hypothetical protein